MKYAIHTPLCLLITVAFLGFQSLSGPCFGQQTNTTPRVPANAFPVCTQFSPLPSGPDWNNENVPLSDELIHETIHEIIQHGFSQLLVNRIPSDPDKKSQIMKELNYAQSLGMKINYRPGKTELFSRDKPSPISVYSPLYAKEVSKQVKELLEPMKEIANLYSVNPYMDEPFHANSGSFDYSEETKVEFIKRYGYPMPDSLDAVRNDPVKWLDFLNFQSDIYRDGWQQVYQIVKKFDSRPKVIITHDSHSTFGAGVKSDAKIAMDDVYHWGGDFADIYIYDIYPYMTLDYRFGDFGMYPKPRISQMHYTIAQMRNLTTTYGKELGYWVGTYNGTWYRDFMGEERKSTYWSEREMSTTAVAQGANFLMTGFNIPEDQKHWEHFGKSLELLQKNGQGIIDAPKVKAKACFLFPRTQNLQLQEEYFNVGLSFELILRTFGELDIIHEEQITDRTLNGYKMLVLCDVKLLPASVAGYIEAFVRKGGIVVADCVPQMDEYKRPMEGMKNLFGVNSSSTDRVIQEGQWVPYAQIDPFMHNPPSVDYVKPVIASDSIAGHTLGQNYGFKVYGPRASKVDRGKSLINMVSGQPALVTNKTGRGKTYLLGFSLQDTYFQTWKNNNITARAQLRSLLSEIFQDVGLASHIYSSNPDIEASVRANEKEAYIFIINHETEKATTSICLRDLEFSVGKILDIGSGNPYEFTKTGNCTEFEVNAPLGTTKILKVLPETR